jgi:predicted nucleic acid-binding protein
VIVIDASALLDALQQDSIFRNLETVMEQNDLITADHLDIECLSAFRKMERLGRVTEFEVMGFLETLEKINCSRLSIQPILTEIWHLRNNFSAYDAAYVAIAMDTGSKLITHDQRLATAAKNLVETVTLFIPLPHNRHTPVKLMA